jgi:hypothetical protein
MDAQRTPATGAAANEFLRQQCSDEGGVAFESCEPRSDEKVIKALFQRDPSDVDG